MFLRICSRHPYDSDRFITAFATVFFFAVMITGFMIVETLAICSIHLTKLLRVHALRHYGLSNRFEELLSALHNANSPHHYNPNSLKLVRLTPHSKKHACQGVPTFMYETWLGFRSGVLSHVTERNYENQTTNLNCAPAMFYTFCCAFVPSSTLL